MDNVGLDSEKLIKELDPKITNVVTFSELCEKLSGTQEDSLTSKKTVLQSISVLNS